MSTDADVHQSLLKDDPRDDHPTTSPTMKDLDSINIVKQLSAACRKRRTTWKLLGYELRLSKDDLSKIEATCSNVEHRCSAMLELWLHQQPDASWETLTEGLINVGLEQLVSMINRKLSGNTSPSNDTSVTNEETESLVVSKEEFQCYSIPDAFDILTSRLWTLLNEANFIDLRRACIVQMHNPDGVELSQKLIKQIQETNNFDDLFHLLCSWPYHCWIDIQLMQAMGAVVEDSQARILLDNYKAAVYSKRLIDVLPDVPSKEVKNEYCTKICAKVMKDPNKMTVADLLKFRTQLEQVIMDINRGICILEHVYPGCVETHWYIPTSFVDKAYQNAKIRHYRFNDLCLLYLKIGSYPVILNQTDVISAPNASADVATDDFKHCVDGVQDIPLDTRTIQIVAHHLTNWEQLAPYLQLTATDMEEIKRDYPTYTEQKYQCIMIWASKNGEAATVINPLWHIYFDLNDKSLVIKIMKELKRKDVDKSSVAQIGHIAIATGRKQTLPPCPVIIS